MNGASCSRDRDALRRRRADNRPGFPTKPGQRARLTSRVRRARPGKVKECRWFAPPELRNTATFVARAETLGLRLLFTPLVHTEQAPVRCSVFLSPTFNLPSIYPAALFFSSYEAAKHALDPKSPLSHMAAASVAETVRVGLLLLGPGTAAVCLAVLRPPLTKSSWGHKKCFYHSGRAYAIGFVLMIRPRQHGLPQRSHT